MRISVLIAIAGFSGVVWPSPAKGLASQAQSVASHDSKASGGPMEEQIVSMERAGLEALKSGDLARFGEVTADEAIMVDAHGSATKAEVLKNVAGFTLTDFSMEGVRFVPVSSNTGLIVYKLTEKGASHGKDFAAVVHVSSLWTKRGAKWVCLFSQETGAR